MEIIPERIRQEWSKDEISVLVLASLLLQIFLIVVSLFRQRCASNLFSFLLWSSYLGADYVATLALGNLLNKQNEALGGNSTGNLAAFWGPFLLLHLGGPDTITSYSLEDNQLWLRHLLGLLLQVFTAIFVFLESLPSPHLWLVSIVVFTAGILKYSERTWSLRSASMLKESMLIQPVEFLKKNIFNQHHNITNIFPKFDGQITEMNDEEIIVWASLGFQVFVDLSADLYRGSRKQIIDPNLHGRINSKQVFQLVEIELSLLHDMLYTKAAHVHSGKGRTMRFLSLTMAVLSLVLFYFTNKENFKPGEIRITYILLIAALAIEVIAIVLLVFSDWTIIALHQTDRGKKLGRLFVKIRRLALGEIAMRWWSNSMKQYNLIRLCLRNYEWKRRNHEWEKLKNKWYGCLRETWDGWFHTNQQTVSDDLKDLIFNVLKDKLNEAPNSTNTNYDRLCASRGEWVLEKKTDTKLEWSVKKEFDESILVWHIATHLCYIEDQPAATVGQDACKAGNKNIPKISQAIGTLRKIWCVAEPPDKDVEQNLSCATTQDDEAKLLHERLEISRKISEYMMFLLLFKPSMLPVGIGKLRFQDTCEQTMGLFFDKDADISKVEGMKLAQERNSISIGYKDTLRAIGSKLMEIWKRREQNLISWEKTKQEKEKAACNMLLSEETSPYISVAKSQLGDACKLVRELQELFKDKREEKWEVISTVWVEMLCYAACRCGTEAHVKQLSHGGELLTHVWLIMLHIGITLNVHRFEYLKGLYTMHAVDELSEDADESNKDCYSPSTLPLSKLAREQFMPSKYNKRKLNFLTLQEAVVSKMDNTNSKLNELISCMKDKNQVLVNQLAPIPLDKEYTEKELFEELSRIGVAQHHLLHAYVTLGKSKTNTRLFFSVPEQFHLGVLNELMND